MLKIQVKESEIHGFGVFASSFIEEGDIIEYCPFIPLEEDEVEDTSILHDYFFGTPFTDDERSIAPLGYAMLYNHSDTPNAEWQAYEENTDLIVFISLKDIPKGTEIFHSYGDDYWSSRDDDDE